MTQPSLKLCRDVELKEFVRTLVLLIGEIIRQARLPTDPAPGTKRVDLLPHSRPRRRVSNAVGLSYGNIERIESGAVQARLRTLKLLTAGVGHSLPTIVARSWLRAVKPGQREIDQLESALQIVDRLPVPADQLFPKRLGAALNSLRGAADPAVIATSARISRGYYLQLERGERNGSLWAFIAACDALRSSLPVLLFIAWTDGQQLETSERRTIARAREIFTALRWRGEAATL